MKNIIIFATGVLIGGATVWFYQEKRYNSVIEEEQIFGDEIAEPEIKETQNYSDLINKPNILDMDSFRKYEIEKSVNKLKETLSNIAKEENYISEEEETEEMFEEPYIIEQEEFRKGAYANYEHVSMYYYTDGALVDLDNPDYPIMDEEVIHMFLGNCLEDITEDDYNEWIYVRNRRNETDYEIQIKDHEFSEREDE